MGNKKRATPILNEDAVAQIFAACFHPEGCREGVLVEGVKRNFYFNPDRLPEHASQIEAFLAELSEKFYRQNDQLFFWSGRQNKHGQSWTESEQHVEELFLLGMAIGRVRYMYNREHWTLGAPYYKMVAPKNPPSAG